MAANSLVRKKLHFNARYVARGGEGRVRGAGIGYQSRCRPTRPQRIA